MRGIVAAGLALLMAVPVSAEVAGQDDPAFFAAQMQWLAGNEAESLPALAGLAGAGNGAARLLLGVIDTTPGLQGTWLMQQDRAARIALLRAPGGISGSNWLRAQGQGDPVSAAWLHLWDGAAAPEVVLEFATLGEPRATRVAGLALAARQVHGFDAIAGKPGFPQVLTALAIRDWQTSAPDRADLALAALDKGDPQVTIFGVEPPADALSDWLQDHPEGDPIVAFCAALCPDEPAPLCRAAAFGSIGGYHNLMRQGAPVEALIGSEPFNRSTMGLVLLLHKMQDVQRARLQSAVPDMASACLADVQRVVFEQGPEPGTAPCALRTVMHAFRADPQPWACLDD